MLFLIVLKFYFVEKPIWPIDSIGTLNVTLWWIGSQLWRRLLPGKNLTQRPELWRKLVHTILTVSTIIIIMTSTLVEINPSYWINQIGTGSAVLTWTRFTWISIWRKLPRHLNNWRNRLNVSCGNYTLYCSWQVFVPICTSQVPPVPP